MKKFIFILILLLILVGATVASLLFASPQIKRTPKNSHTIRIDERDEKKLVTASQYIDFVTLLISDDRKNEYIEYQTFKVEAGIDLNRDPQTVKIMNKPVSVDRTVLRGKLADDNYDKYIKPVRSAFALKACDISVEYNILENAKKNISRTDEFVFGINKDELKLAANKKTNVQYLPCVFETFGDTLNDDVKLSLLNNLELNFEESPEEFGADAQKIYITGKGKNNYIQFGYSGKIFADDTFKSFKERLYTENKDITVFTYFDPLDDRNEKQVLSYASDNFVTAFILSGGKLYFINAHSTDSETRASMGEFVLYLAMSLKFDAEKEDVSNEYFKYLEDYASALNALRNKKYSEYNAYVNDMIQQKKIKFADSQNYTDDEKMFVAAANYFSHKEDFDVTDITSDREFNTLLSNSKFLYDSGMVKGDFSDGSKREKLLSEITSRSKKYNAEIKSNVLTYFLQNENMFNLSETEKNNYLREIREHACAVDRVILESFETDSERNKFYAELFSNAYKSKYFIESHSDMTFFYTLNAHDIMGSGNLEKILVKRNGEIPLGNVFVFVFSESDLPLFSDTDKSDNEFVQFLKDAGQTVDNLTKTVHAIVLDNCSARLFTCIDNDTLLEKFISYSDNVRKWITQKNTVKPGAIFSKVPEYVYFWDWRKMNIYKDGTAFLGYDFSNTANYNAVSKRMFQKSERFEEIRTVGEVLLQLQNAYENDTFHYNLAMDFFDRQVRNYMYDKLWRPSLNVSDAATDKMERYNYIWSD